MVMMIGDDGDDDRIYLYFFCHSSTLFTFVSKVNKANNNSHDKDTLLKYLTLFNLHVPYASM